MPVRSCVCVFTGIWLPITSKYNHGAGHRITRSTVMGVLVGHHPVRAQGDEENENNHANPWFLCGFFFTFTKSSSYNLSELVFSCMEMSEKCWKKRAEKMCECTKITATAIISIKGNNYSSRNTNNRFNTDRSNIRGLRVGFHERPSWGHGKNQRNKWPIPSSLPNLRSADDLYTISLGALSGWGYADAWISWLFPRISVFVAR